MKRYLTAVALIAVFGLAIGYLPEEFLLLVVAVVAVVALTEYSAMILPESTSGGRALFVAISVAPVVWCSRGGPAEVTAVLTLTCLAIATAFLMRSRGDFRKAVWGMSTAFFGTFYISFLLGHSLFYLDMPLGRRWIFLVLIATYAGDSGAFFVGKRFGRHKLAANVSPNKTWEGALGGLVASVVAVEIFQAFAIPSLGLGEAALLAVLIGGAAQIGDLVESMIKRSANIKDSANFLPGHGGMLDRIDSLLFALPVAWYSIHHLFPFLRSLRG